MPKEAQPDPAIIVGATVVTASIRWPLKIDGQRNVYGIWVTDQAGGAHRFASHDPPETLSADGEPLNLPAELMTGSVVNLEVAGDRLLTIQIVKHVARNPFAARTRPVQTAQALSTVAGSPSTSPTMPPNHLAQGSPASCHGGRPSSQCHGAAPF
jgi:hypothetical protein